MNEQTSKERVQEAISVVRIMLPKSGSITKETIEQKINSVLLLDEYKSIDRNLLIREIESLYNIRTDDFRIIEAEERKNPWIKDIKSDTNWTFWNRYKEYLQLEKRFPISVLSQIDKLTDRTLDGLFNPTEKVIVSKRGLVVGQVQSGKTSNYTGLICKAADSGYRLIIVLAGIHNNLRSQTQLRLDEGFLGFDTQHQRAFHQNGISIGVGNFGLKGIAHSLTSSLEKGDFTAGAANSLGINFNTTEPIIAVVKKNTTVLKNLISWLKAQTNERPDGKKSIRDKALLLIDDEADNASINTSSPDSERTQINKHICNILDLFDRSGYVGYTATPFANIFIDINDDNLFPRDFIVNLPAPSNYIGPKIIFGINDIEESDELIKVLPIVNRIDDYNEFIPNVHKITDQLPDRLPNSLHTAIKCFIITCTIRRLRGQINVHNSMLIHVSRFKKWQNCITTLVEEVFDYYKFGIENNNPKIINELKGTFEDDYEYNTSYNGENVVESYKGYSSITKQIAEELPDIDTQLNIHKWEDVLDELYNAVVKIVVKQINGGSADILNYYDHKNGLSVIAIGGNKLSRGLTLEGLSISYYLRASKMYDTLMQMGRWFGYRPGYVDLCRLFTSRELNEWFCHITDAAEGLRKEFNYMSDVAGSTPEKFALKVKNHPGVLQISASNKIRNAVPIKVSWSGRLAQSYQLQKNLPTREYNLSITKNLIDSLPDSYTNEPNYILWKNISVDKVKPFFQSFKVSENLKRVEPEKLLEYIKLSVKNDELTSWSIAIIKKEKANSYFLLNSKNGIEEIGCVNRSDDGKKSDDNNFYIIQNQIISPEHEFLDLDAEILERAYNRTVDFYKNQNKDYTYNHPKGEIVRNEFRDQKNPLLILYFLDSKKAGIEKDNGIPLIGFAVSFPKSKSNISVSYAVNQHLLPMYDIDTDLEEYED